VSGGTGRQPAMTTAPLSSPAENDLSLIEPMEIDSNFRT